MEKGDPFALLGGMQTGAVTVESSTETPQKIKRKPTEWENIFANDTLDKKLISKIYLKTYTTQHQENEQSN